MIDYLIQLLTDRLYNEYFFGTFFIYSKNKNIIIYLKCITNLNNTNETTFNNCIN